MSQELAKCKKNILTMALYKLWCPSLDASAPDGPTEGRMSP